MAYPVPQGHPRVMVRPADLPRLREMATTTHRAEFDALLKLSDLPGELTPKDHRAPDLFRLAFLYLLSTDPGHAKLAIRFVEHVLSFPPHGEYRAGIHELKALSCAYDWLHDRLSPELKRRIADYVMTMGQMLYQSNEIEEGVYLLGHAANELPYLLMACTAIGDEQPQHAAAVQGFLADIFRRYDRMLEGYRVFLSGDAFQQSMSYTSTYTGEIPWVFQQFEVAFGRPMYEQNRWYANVIKWWTYGMRDDLSFIRYGDYFCAQEALKNAQYYRTIASIAGRYGDGLAQWWLGRMDVPNVEPEAFFFEQRPGPAPQAPDELPRTRIFEPMGLAIARGDFDTTGSPGPGQPGKGGTVAAFKCTPVYLHNHGHRDANSFTIYHRGEQAMDSGAYDSYETPHWYNYYIRSIAHNTLVIHDPKEKFISRGKEYANDGGQRFINEPWFQPRTLEEARMDVFRDGTILKYQDGDGFSYVVGDASNCYSRQKLTRFHRHVVFVLDWPHKAAVSLLVVDDIELAREELVPRFLLHVNEQPRIDGHRILSKSGGGRLTTTVLEPAEAKIELIGGPGKEFWVDGKNYPLNRQMSVQYHPGAWRAEVSHVGARGTTRQFVTLLVPADIDQPSEPAATLERRGGEIVVKQGRLTVTVDIAKQAASAIS